MTLRLNIVLALVLVFSCVWLIRSSNDSRRLFSDLEKAQARSHELQIDYERLQLDKRAQATPLRVEKLAREKLHMFNNSPTLTHYVSTSASVSASGVAPAAASGVSP
ncbi:cell division protein FtsL [Aquabacterium sp.]|uniref:cell division protein FtsL n=1 Tax=Aquabacterium sp. TaxID=1872578 RepID=UPI0025C39C6A|nr:cell division protein FtsL [Aquabacterium sp.]